MTFPTIQTADTKNGVQTSNATNWTLTYPTNLVSGDLILAFTAVDGNTATESWPDGFRGITGSGSGGANTGSCWAKVSDGTETGNFTVTFNSEQGAWRVFRITGWYGGLPTTDFGVDGTGIEGTAWGLGGGSPSSTPNPRALNPTNWDVEDTLWFASCSLDTSRTISVFPLAGNNSSDVSGGSTGATLGLCTTTSAVSSLDPGTFTISASDDWVTNTVAVRPAASAASAGLVMPPYPRFVEMRPNV